MSDDTNSPIFQISGRSIGGDEKPLIIAEVAQAHDGSIDFAHSFIDLAAHVGADAVKFQTHIAREESTKDEPFRKKFSVRRETRYDYWKRMEFTDDQWRGLADHAAEKGLLFLSSAFSVKAVHFLDTLEMPAWKVGSGEIGSTELLQAMAATGKPVLLSSGMSNWDELSAAVRVVTAGGAPVAIFQCTTSYPSGLEEVGLNVLNEIRERFNVPVGLSDHSGSIWPAVASMALGASIIEAHLTFHELAFGPDVPASLTPAKFCQLVEARDAIHTMRLNPIDKQKQSLKKADMRQLFSKSLAPVRDLSCGEVLTGEMVTFKKPGTGISRSDAQSYFGRTLSRDVPHDRLFQPDDFI